MNTSKSPVWLDCDPGHDDAMAIILAGNQSVEKTTANAISILEASGRSDVPVFMGAKKPLIRVIKHDPEIHGESGLDGTDLLPKCNKALYEKAESSTAINEMAKAILESSSPVHLVALGSLTNIALLVTVYPQVIENIEVFSFMGGAIGVGNRSAVAEFNILCDPEAAQIVMQAGFKHMAMVPLDVTHTALVTNSVLNQIESKVGPVNKNFSIMVKELMLFFKDSYAKTFGFNNGPPLHDPLAVYYLTNRASFEEKLMRVDVECGNGMCAGQTVCDIWEYSTAQKNCYVTSKVDVESFWEAMINSMALAAKNSPL
ncbi:Inosine-uridine-preferring nucleoside hydrolase-like protein [Smittium culicis]|uniref:Inosine-uridine-preferring nucleoside hydrolase-like protein n=2 Tax=Smittium culicis TaxID=133412 RepID=A0A1R1XBA5_9FUNG|nr:Inosine-uridine-preferring nucleoside hydrolase-like protein [Smittium culicis]OMJ11922.1 Inosine-uridine-preferring nucleoside hydrolase-like protein [Smittium culicis]OMJ14542.1 Inosine-uridine-preferring nucleoside hydrolase-like protein [Smittium culicis]